MNLRTKEIKSYLLIDKHPVAGGFDPFTMLKDGQHIQTGFKSEGGARAYLKRKEKEWPQ